MGQTDRTTAALLNALTLVAGGIKPEFTARRWNSDAHS